MLTFESPSNGHYRSGDLYIDVDRRRLTRAGHELKLTKLNFRLLQALASAAPALLTKDDLADKVWAGRVVSPETVAQRVKLLRDALQDDAHDPRYIEVVRGQGYRWIPEVETTELTSEPTTQFLGNPDAPKEIDLALPNQPSVAVLPFDTLGDDNLDHQIFAEGLTHDVITCIGRARWLFVVARGSAFMFRGHRHNVRDVSERLGVRYVVQGSIRFSGKRISVHAALADAVEGKEIWAEQIRGDAEDVFAIQEEISNLVVGSVESEIEYTEQQRALLEPPASLNSWTAYHRGWWHLNSFSVDCCDKAEHYFSQSIELDPQSARPHAGMSCVHWLRAFLEITDDREGDIQKSLESALQSLALDSRDPLSHWAMGRALHLCRDFDRSVAEYEIANKLNPNFALGQFAQAFAMMHVGDHERSNQILDNARRLSPYDTMSYAMLGVQAVNHAMLDRFEVAADLSIRGAGLLSFYCQMFPVIAAYCNVLAGRDDVGAKYFRKLQDTRPGYNSDDYFRAFPHQRDSDIAKISGAFEKLQQLH